MNKSANKKSFSDYFNFWNIILLLSIALIGIFIVYPLVSLLSKSVLVNGKLSLESFKDFATLPYYYSTLFNSMKVSITATIFGTLLGLPMAYFIARYDIPFKKFINICIILSLMSPPFIGAYSWIMLLGRNGAITNFVANFGINMPSIYGFTGIILVYSLKLFPYVYLYVSGALQNIDSSLEEASESLGMSSWRRLITVTLPLVTPTIASGALMVFMTSLADFGTPMLIGEGYRVLPVVVYQEFMSETGGNDSMASALSVIIIIFSVLVLLLQTYVVNRKSYEMSALRPPTVKKLPPIPKVFATLFCYIVLAFAMLPQITVIISSFRNTNGPVFAQGFGIQSYKDVFYKLGTNVRNTLVYSTVAIIIMVLLGMLISYCIVRRRSIVTTALDIFVMLPYVIPGAVLGITLLTAFNKPPIMISGTALIMIIAYVVRKMPYTLRSSTSILYQINPSVDEASISLGVSPLKTFFKVTAVMMIPGVISGAVISWVTTINELSSSIMLYTGRTGTISVAIYNEVVRGGFGTAAALATILTVITTCTLLIFFKVTGRDTINI